MQNTKNPRIFISPSCCQSLLAKTHCRNLCPSVTEWLEDPSMDQVRARNEIAARTVQGSHPKVTASKICTQKWILYDFISFGQMPFFRDFLKVMLKTLCWEKKWRSKNHIQNSIGNSQKLPFWKHRFFSEDSTVKQAGELIKTPPKSSVFFRLDDRCQGLLERLSISAVFAFAA